MTIYCAANIGLALQSNWTALFVLRMVQSAGIAATIALGYGVVSDIAPPSERGSFVSIMVLGQIMVTNPEDDTFFPLNTSAFHEMYAYLTLDPTLRLQLAQS
ncbi:hypothetical protein ACHAQC_009892 [Fusarium culmorum]